MNRKITYELSQVLNRGILVFMAGLCLVSCGPHLVHGQSPFVQVTAWEIQGHRLLMDLRIRNVNDVELAVENIDFSITLKDTELTRYNQPASMVISARGSETIGLELEAADAGVDLLVALQEGELASLPYAMAGQIQSGGKELMKFDREGHIYTVPGRPGHFR